MALFSFSLSLSLFVENVEMKKVYRKLIKMCVEFEQRREREHKKV
jgi:hypothetical protein